MTQPQRNARQPYRPPQITDLGDFRKLTQTTGTKGGAKNDGKGLPATRF